LERLAPGMEGTLHCATSYADANFCGGFPETVAFAIHQGQPIEAAGPYDNGELVGTERFSMVAKRELGLRISHTPTSSFLLTPSSMLFGWLAHSPSSIFLHSQSS